MTTNPARQKAENYLAREMVRAKTWVERARIAADFAERLAMADRAILREAVDNTGKDKAFLRAVKQLSVADYHARVPLPWAEAMQEGAIDEAERKLHAEVRAYLAGEP